MLYGTIRRLCNRKALFGLCVLVTGLGLVLILLAAVGGIIHLLSPDQSNETGEGMLFRLIGGVVLLIVGFTGLVLGSANSNENLIDWMEGWEQGEAAMEICCCSCKALNDVQALCCRDCGADLSPAEDRVPQNANGGWLESRFCEPPELAKSGGSLRSIPATHRKGSSSYTDRGIGVRTRFSIRGLHVLNVQGRGDKIKKISPETERAFFKTSR